ncbi:MAG: enoyl-CoA hydratase/isomerase family protein [Alphaproteobacteria bacterium]|nr:enoyl-CoA hydratase/isomerase family protein [Alphaproteobacteria bacterium]
MDEVLFEQRGRAGLITLNRPKALNALTLGMVDAMDAQLRAWRSDASVELVVVRGAGERAFCAGGDIRALYDSGRSGTPYVIDFYRREYRLNRLIKRYPKPYIAVINGIVMGGGVGVSIHGAARVCGEGTMFAMPETGIGLFPDVGGTHFLPRCPGETGLYLALTGARLDVTDSAYVGVATHVVPVAQHNALLAALCADELPVEHVLSHFAVKPETKSRIEGLRAAIDRHFSCTSVEGIISSLKGDTSLFADQTLTTLASKSPTSLRVTFNQIREGVKFEFEECMKLEFRLTNRFMHGHDFYEGVRAVIIEKDNAPKWQPADLAGVSDSDVAKYFAPLGEAELTFEQEA